MNRASDADRPTGGHTHTHRQACPLLAFCFVLSLSALAHGSTTVRVVGKTNLDVHAMLTSRGVIVRGQLRDDAGRGVNSPAIRLGLDKSAHSTRQGTSISACAPSQAAYPDPAATERFAFVVEGHVTGDFCARLPDLSEPVSITVRYEDTGGLYQSTEKTVQATRTTAALTLQFVRRPERFALERSFQLVSVKPRLHTESGLAASVVTALEPLSFTLYYLFPDGTRAKLGRASSRPGEQARFEFPSKLLRGPGPGGLRVEFAGSAMLNPSSAEVRAGRSAVVTLSTTGPPPNAELDDIQLRVGVRSAYGAVEGGAVEASQRGQTVGIAKVVDGSVSLPVRLPQDQVGPVRVVLTYAPDSPWWRPGQPFEATIFVKPPGLWRRVPWALAATALLCWLYLAWRRPTRDRAAASKPKRVRPAKATINVLDHARARSGWHGWVADAHEQTPIANAAIVIRSPSFSGTAEVASATTDSEGRFHIPYTPAVERDGARLVVSAEFHSRLEQPVPPCGTLQICLMSRRRALLERFAAWTRRWKPRRGGSELTPGHVARTASGRSAGQIATWARELEHAAYGPSPPDETIERKLREQEPDSH